MPNLFLPLLLHARVGQQDFSLGTLSQPRQPYGPRMWAAREERREGRIEGEVKRKVKGIERLRLEQVPLSGNGLAARCHDQTRVCTASTVLAEEQPGKLNFGWNGRRRGEVEKKVYEGVDEGEGMLRAQVSRKGGEAEEDGGARRPFPRDSPI